MAKTMKKMYVFDSIIDRRSTDSVKWDVGAGELPMWIADMDFATAPAVTEALKKRLESPIFGYSDVTDEWYQAYIGWWSKRYDLEIKKDWLVFCTGVVPAISSMVRKLTRPGDKVIVQTPVYNIFFNSIINNGCMVLENRLSYKNGRYSVDFSELEKQMEDPRVTLMILCNPHNPVGKIWDNKTLEKIAEIAAEHNVPVISDEIHCDITKPGKKYVPFLSVSETAKKIGIACVSPSKSFNIAGLSSAAVVIPDPNLRRRVVRGLNTDEVAEPGSFAQTAVIAAYNEGAAWLDELRSYVFENRRLCENYFEENIPEIKVVKADATYLLWLDASALPFDSEVLNDFIRRDQGLVLCAGREYGTNGEGFLRMNIACPREILTDGLRRLRDSIENYKKGIDNLKNF